MSSGEFKAANWGRCIGMVDGIVEAGQHRPDEWRFEIPYGVTSLQTRQVVLKYADNHPEKTHFEFGAFVVLSFHDAWPCKK